MEFNFPLNPYFKSEINKIGSRLLPEGFFGDRREVQECITRVSTILTALGENSAKAQSLQNVITSGDKLRNSNYSVYILVDIEGGTRGYGTVLGMLKVGVKNLYLFDSSGNNHEVQANCILDFYVHESKQRMGFGKTLFEYMLKEEQVEPKHMAIDKPSPKLMSFLHKHYGLETIIPQMNNFVLFEGFFDNRNDRVLKEGRHKMAAGISSGSCRHLSGETGAYNEPLPASPRQKPSTPPAILQNQTPTQANTPAAASRAESIVPSTPDPQFEVEEPEEAPEPEPEEEIAPIEDLHLDEVEKGEDAEDALQADPLPCKIQAGNGNTHLDLKFYHSSLW